MKRLSLPSVEPLRAWWRLRPPRERWMLLGGGIAVILVLLDTLWTAPLEKRTRRAATELATRQDALDKAAPGTPLAAADLQRLRDQEAALRERLQAAQEASDRLGRQTLELPRVLRTVTGQMGSLRLVALELSPDASLAVGGSGLPGSAPGGSAGAAPGASAGATLAGRRVYRLPLSLTVSGPYSDLQRLVAHIEKEAPSLQWTSFSLDSSDWPAIRLTLKAQAISLSPTWGSAS
ncbi:MAG: type II secretion system protein M [Rubrivivax sp.]|nr:type II secretion system protein M [Rubrivivax sp.]